MSNSFINQNDPTGLLDLSSVNLRTQYTQLTDREKMLVFCKINGYIRIPPTIEQLYTDSYYLGGEDFFDGGNNIYDYWKDKLSEVFINPFICKFPFIILQPAIGCGKSTMARLIMAYNYAKLLCMRSPSRTFHLTPKPLSFVIYHRDATVGEKEFKHWFRDEVMTKAPFFKNTKPSFKLQVLVGGPRSAVGLGSDVILYILSELNFFPNQEAAQGIVETAYGRFTSRFDDSAMSMAGNIILDSSPKGNTSCAEWFIDNSPREKTWNCRAAHYEVKPQSYRASGDKTFSVYVTDGKYPSTILPEDYRLLEDQDPERVIKAPIQLIGEAKMNITKFLQDKCGVSTGASDLFFGGSVKAMSDCMSIPNKIPETHQVDFFDKTDQIINHIYPALFDIVPTTSIWIGLDLATSSDQAGIAGVLFDGWEIINEVKWPRIKVAFVVGIGRKEGQETSLFHVFDLIMSLKKDYNVVVSADQAFSKQILQDCEREGIKTNGRISTDNVPCDPALYLKNLILLGLIKIPDNKRLLREAYDLKYVPTKKGYKIDHPKKATQKPSVFDVNNGKGSKDLWDALASACYSLKMSIDAGEESGYSSGVDKQLEMVKSMTKSDELDTQKEIQSRLENLF